MQFIDLKTQYKTIESAIHKNINTVLEHGKFVMGPEIKELETTLAQFAGTEYCISCSSGTDALLLALMAANIGPGDAVFTSPFTFIATAEVIALLGATPIFVDIDPQTFNIAPDKLEEAIKVINNGQKVTPRIPDGLRPKAIIPVDLFGLPADYDIINKLAKEYGLLAIEDAAQGFGGEYKGKMAGNLTDLATTSFFPAKPLGCYGDGGAIFTNNKDLADNIISLRIHGKGKDKYDNIRIGINGRLDTLQAAIVLAKMEIFEDEIKQRQMVAKRYSDGLKDTTVVVPFVPQGYKSVWAQYSILSNDKEKIMAKLKAQNIPTAVYYTKSLHLQTAFSYLGYKSGSMPVSEETSQKIFSLPMHPYLQVEEQQMIIDTIIND